jgi:virginiamycin B lyase
MTTRGVVSTVVQLPDSTSAPPNPPDSMPMVLTAGNDGAMYYTTYFELTLNYIGRVTPAGKLTKFDIPTAGAASFGITAARDGAIWFTENFNNSIGRLRVRGQ